MADNPRTTTSVDSNQCIDTPLDCQAEAEPRAKPDQPALVPPDEPGDPWALLAHWGLA
jgi:hypothetical protein